MLRSVDQVDLKGKRVLLRADLDAPLDAAGRLADDARVRAALPTLRLLLDRGAKVIVASHFGRAKDSIEPAAARLAELLGGEVRLADDCVGDGVRKLAGELRAGEVLVLENLRAHREDEAGSADFARELAAIGEAYVGDAFGVAHRASASVALAPALVPGPRAAGLQLQRELEVLRSLARGPARPYVVLLGGGESAEKLRALDALLKRADALLLAGPLATVFLQAQGVPVGQSPVDGLKLELARAALQKAEALGVRIVLPFDHLCGDPAEAGARPVHVESRSVPDALAAWDLGPRTQGEYRLELLRAKTVFWAGAVGTVEREGFGEGTRAMARALAEARGQTIVAAGASARAIAELGLAPKVSHVSAGSAAAIELLEGRALPGVQALE